MLPYKSLLRTRQYLDDGGNRDEAGNFIAWLCRQEQVYAYMLDSYVWDIGTRDHNRASASSRLLVVE
jgi:hypothetical protein